MVTAAAKNERHGVEVVRMLLGHAKDLPVSEAMVMAAKTNGARGLTIIWILLKHTKNLPVSEATATAIINQFGHKDEILQLLLQDL